MHIRVLALTTSALILACGSVGATAQERMTTPQLDQQQMQSHAMDEHESGTIGHAGMGRGMMGGAMMHGMVAGGTTEVPVMLRMMFALMDADGDGTVELPEFQAAHERIFKAMDANKDG